jgi:intein-encoded DNA endonuclease-like protein
VDVFLSSRIVIVQQAVCTKRAEVTSTDYVALFIARTNSFRESTSHSWNNKPSTAQSEVFLLQVVIYQATNPDTPFVVTETSFSDLRDKTEDELEAMLEVLKKKFIQVFLDGKGITCFYSGLEVVPLTHAGDKMLSFHQEGIRP